MRSGSLEPMGGNGMTVEADVSGINLRFANAQRAQLLTQEPWRQFSLNRESQIRIIYVLVTRPAKAASKALCRQREKGRAILAPILGII